MVFSNYQYKSLFKIDEIFQNTIPKNIKFCLILSKTIFSDLLDFWENIDIR